MFENEYEINVELTVFTTVRASTKQDAYEAACNEIKKFFSGAEPCDRQGQMYQINDLDIHDIKRVEID